MKWLGLLACMLTMSPMVWAADLALGTWVSRSTALVLTIEDVDGGQWLTYKVKGNDRMTITVLTHLDGTDAPVLVNGKPSDETIRFSGFRSRCTMPAECALARPSAA